MQTMQQHRHRDARLVPHGGNPGRGGSQYRAVANSVADAADRAMLEALSDTQKDWVQSPGQ